MDFCFEDFPYYLFNFKMKQDQKWMIDAIIELIFGMYLCQVLVTGSGWLLRRTGVGGAYSLLGPSTPNVALIL